MKSKLQFLFSGLGALVLLLPFLTNCSNSVSFIKDYTDVNFETKSLSFYYNTRLINIRLNTDKSVYGLMRSSLNENITSNWVPTTDEFIFDLGSEYNSDGSKDGSKVIYTELKDPSNLATDKIVKMQTRIFLDTQTPKIQGLGLLMNGLNGLNYNLHQTVTLQLQGTDPNSLSQVNSGIDPDHGLKMGLSHTNDCSESNLYQVRDWGRYSNSIDLDWPASNPLESFYICLFVKDKAGNVGNFLSQPMTSLWTVLAGDNNQGDGASVTDSHVRFKTLGNLYWDANNNLQVSDVELETVRNIHSQFTDPNRIINSTPTKYYSSTIIYDQNQRGYAISKAGGLITFVNGAEKPITATGNGQINILALALRNVNNVESLVFASRTDPLSANNPATDAYLFEIPVADIQSKMTSSTPFNRTNLLPYIIAGNGVLYPSSCSLSTGTSSPVVVTPSLPRASALPATDCTVAAQSIGQVVSIVTTEGGDIIFAENKNGSGKNISQSLIKKLVAAGTDSTTGLPKWNQTILMSESADGVPFFGQLAYHKSSDNLGQIHELVAWTSSAGSKSGVYNLITTIKSFPFTDVVGRVSGIAIETPPTARDEYSFYLSNQTTSQILHYDKNFQLTETLGRPVFNDFSIAPSINALIGVIGYPDGLFLDRNSNEIYFIDSQNNVINKISGGMMFPIAGHVNQGMSPTGSNQYSNKLLSEAYLNSAGWDSGTHYGLAGDFQSSKNRKILYFHDRVGNMQVLDLVNNKVNTLKNPTGTELNLHPDWAKFKWAGNGLLFVPDPSDQNLLLISKSWGYISTSDTWHKSSVSFLAALGVTEAKFNGRDSIMGDVSNNDLTTNTGLMANNSVALYNGDFNEKINIDSTKNIFYSGRQLKITNSITSAHPITRVIPNLSIEAFQILEDPAKPNIRTLVYFANKSLNVVEINMDQIFTNQWSQSSFTPKKLKLPGTELVSPGDVILDKDGNLIISDTSQGRIIKYNIKGPDGNLLLQYDSP